MKEKENDTLREEKEINKKQWKREKIIDWWDSMKKNN